MSDQNVEYFPACQDPRCVTYRTLHDGDAKIIEQLTTRIQEIRVAYQRVHELREEVNELWSSENAIDYRIKQERDRPLAIALTRAKAQLDKLLAALELPADTTAVPSPTPQNTP